VTLPARDLWPHLVRAVSWQSILVGGFVALALAGRGFDAPLKQTLAAAALALGASFAFDDPAAATLASSPSPLWWRRATRLALTVPLAAVIWLAVVFVARLSPGATGSANLEATTLLAIVLCSAAVSVGRRGDGVGSVAAAPTLLAFLATAMALPARWALYPVGDRPGVWAVVLAAAVVAMFVACRDPAAPRLLAPSTAEVTC
jgi:hypothetical protein